MLLADRTDFWNRLNGADFVIGVHNAHQRCVLPDGVFHLIGGNKALVAHRQVSDLKSFLFQRGTGMQHRMMFKYSRDNMLFAFWLPSGGLRL